MRSPLSTGTDILASLKASTAEAHQRLEGQVRFLDPAAPLSEYARYLGKMLAFHAPLEEALARVALPEGLEGREKRALLEADLRALGVDPSRVERCGDLPDVATVPRALGCAYVLEGATLGGKHVLRRMGDRVPAGAAAYLGCYGADVGVRWNAFRELVRRHVSAADEAACVAGAVDTFEALSRWMAR